MRNFLFLGFLLSACANSISTSAPQCSGDTHVGRWYHADSNDTLTLNADLTGSATVCAYVFNYTAPQGANGSIAISIQSTSGGPTCQTGTFNCNYVLSQTELGLNCGNGSVYYQRLCD